MLILLWVFVSVLSLSLLYVWLDVGATVDRVIRTELQRFVHNEAANMRDETERSNARNERRERT